MMQQMRNMTPRTFPRLTPPFFLPSASTSGSCSPLLSPSAAPSRGSFSLCLFNRSKSLCNEWSWSLLLMCSNLDDVTEDTHNVAKASTDSSQMAWDLWVLKVISKLLPAIFAWPLKAVALAKTDNPFNVTKLKQYRPQHSSFCLTQGQPIKFNTCFTKRPIIGVAGMVDEFYAKPLAYRATLCCYKIRMVCLCFLWFSMHTYMVWKEKGLMVRIISDYNTIQQNNICVRHTPL